MTGSSGWIKREERIALYIRDSFTCCYCGKNLKNAQPYQVTLDHLEDLVNGGGHKGGNHAHTNLVTSCNICNSSRQDTPLATFAAKFDGAMERIEVQRYATVNIALAKSIIAGK